MALKQFDCNVGEGINTDMRAVRKDYFLDHDHSSYVDQWDWERVITAEDAQPRLPEGDRPEDLEGHQRRRGLRPGDVPASSRTRGIPSLPKELTFLHAEEILEHVPGPAAQAARDHDPAGVSRPSSSSASAGSLKDGYPHEMRAADYDDWVTPTRRKRPARTTHGLNGDILVWNPVTKRRHELTSMGIRVTKETLKQQLEITGQLDFLKLPYHQAIMNDQIPLSIGGGIGQSRTVHAPAAQGAPRRGERHRVAEGAEGDLREEEHPRAGIATRTASIKRGGASRPSLLPAKPDLRRAVFIATMAARPKAKMGMPRSRRLS